MKKIFAMLLIIALLLPMGITANAAEAEIKPFYFANWSSVGDDEGYTNVYPMVYLWADGKAMAEGEVYITCPSLGGSTPETIAENIKEEFDKYPAGARYINFSPLATAFGKLGEVCYLEKAIPVILPWVEAFMSHYKKIGGKLDGFTIDVEYLNVYTNYIQSNFANKDPLVYDWIVKQPKYQEWIRPRLVERGFKFYENVSANTPEIYSIHPNSGAQYSQSRSIWNTVMRAYIGDAINRCCAPLWKYYPDALLSDYCTKDTKAWHKDQEAGYGGGNHITAGNMSNENFYGIRPSTNFYTDASTKGPAYSTIPGYNGAIYELTAFHRFMNDANVAKTSAMSTDNGNISWWIVGHGYGTKGEGTICNTPYYAENIIHQGMQDPKIFLGYVLKQDAPSDDYDHWVLSLHIIDDVLKELTRVVGGADRERIDVPPTWNEHYVLSGMHVGGKNIWRLTPDTTKVSLEGFKVEGTDPTFSVNGQTITFPGGKIIETGSVREVGTCGYWIETAEDVYPIATKSANYFRDYPAYAETFEGYDVGMEFNYNNASPEGCWEPKKEGSGTATIVADGNGKALAMKGGYSVKLVKLLKNITAGDTYAENQAWEITVKLPADLAADAELVLLNYTDAKNKAKGDGGFKVVGGKVYYCQDKDYIEMPGVTLANGNAYTFIRELNFNDENNFTSNYTVYDAAGNVVGQVKNIPVLEFALPVDSVSFSCKKVTGEAVIVDDFKLYPTRVATDFYLYDAATGMPVTEMDKARDSATAYRLSWLNATDKEKSYTVMAAYYNGETLVEEKVVKEIKMAPYADSVITGIVENQTEGQTVKVYLRDNNPAEGEEPTGTEETVTPPPQKTGLRKEIKLSGSFVVELWVIIVVIAGVLVLAAGAVILIAAKKQKKNPTEE